MLVLDRFVASDPAPGRGLVTAMGPGFAFEHVLVHRWPRVRSRAGAARTLTRVTPPPPDYSFLWKPRWILSHVFILALVVTFVNLGFWQLRRLDERRTYNALVESRQDLPAATVDELLPERPVDRPRIG